MSHILTSSFLNTSVVNHTSDIYFPPAEYLGPIPHLLITEFCTMIMSLLEKQKIVELQTLYSSLHLQTSQAPLSFQVSKHGNVEVLQAMVQG